jgi:polyferredoxin
MNKLFARQKIVVLCAFIQWGFFFYVVFIGIRFGMFVRHFENGGMTPFVSRPPGVEGFLPIGALVSLKYWLVSGTINPVHPAALVIFLSIVLMSLLAKKSFCSWLCPVGTLSEDAAILGRRIFGRNFTIWRRLDVTLRGVKYLLLLFFVKLILIDMPAQALSAFLDTPYWALSDVKMLHFFTQMSVVTMVVLTILMGLSFLYANFWCRYLCPYGALLGLVSILSPWKIRRDVSSCTGCGSCSAACPSSLPVHAREVVRSAECNGCLSCVVNCPEKDPLRMAPPLGKQPLPVWVYATVVVLLFAGGIVAGIATGNWQSSLGYADYRQLMPMVPYLSH